MSNKTPRPLAEVIARPGSALAELAREAEAHLDLATSLRRALPADLAAALGAANLHEDGTLVVTAASPAWAARLRFEEARLFAACTGRQPAALRLKIRVAGPPAGG